MWIAFASGMLAALVLSPFDQTLSDLARGFWQDARPAGPLQPALNVVQFLGKADTLVLLALTLGALGYKRQAVAMLLALLLAAGLVWPLKVAVHRERPNHSSRYSFPSGDAAVAAAAAWPLMMRFPRGLAPIGAGVLLVAAGRVLTAAHYPSDVAAGTALGLLGGGMALGLLRRIRLGFNWRHFAGAAAALAAAGLIAGAVSNRGDPARMAQVMTHFGPPAVLAVAWRLFRAGRRHRRRIRRGGG